MHQPRIALIVIGPFGIAGDEAHHNAHFIQTTARPLQELYLNPEAKSIERVCFFATLAAYQSRCTELVDEKPDGGHAALAVHIHQLARKHLQSLMESGWVDLKPFAGGPDEDAAAVKGFAGYLFTHSVHSSRGAVDAAIVWFPERGPVTPGVIRSHLEYHIRAGGQKTFTTIGGPIPELASA